MADPLSSIIGGVFGYFGNEQQNRAAQDQAIRAQTFSAGQVSQQEDFQREMSSTAYQRATADMKAAGLNPMLAYSQGGASAPSGSSASGVAAPVQSQITGALQGATTAANVDLITAQAKKADAEADLTRARTPKDKTDMNLGDAELQNLIAQANANANRVGLTEAETQLAIRHIENAVKTGSKIEADTANTKVNTVLNTLDIPKAQNAAEAQKSAYMRNVAPYTGEAATWAGTASKIRSMFRQ